MEMIATSPTSPEKDSTAIKEQPSPRSTVEEEDEKERERERAIDTLQVSQAGRLSASPVSTEENGITSQSSPPASPPKMTAAIAMIEEMNLKDLEISDDGLSDDEEEEEERGEGRGNEEAPIITIKPSSPQQQEEGIEQKETRLSAPPSTTGGGKKMMKNFRFHLSLVLDRNLKQKRESNQRSKEKKSFPLLLLEMWHISKQPETDLVVEGEKEPITSPETFLDVSSDEERAEETVDHPLAAATSEVIDSEVAEGQEKDADIERKQGDMKVEVLDSASMPYSDDHVQDIGTVEEVLEVLKQKLSSDEESDESEEEEEEEEEEGEELRPEGVELRREEEKEEEQREDKLCGVGGARGHGCGCGFRDWR